MLIIPAIDLRAGKCVRLRQGDYEQETIFSDDPVAVARRWVERGARRLHLVDLDGARDGKPTNGAAVREIAQTCGVPCQLGGGLRTDETIADALSWGVQYVVVGTRAAQDPAWLAVICERFQRRIFLGIDARQGQVATEGWKTTTELPALELAKRCMNLPLAGLIYTDIDRDGMLSGANIEAYAQLVAALPLPVIASGGVTTREDIRRLFEVGASGCIVGRALYEGRLDLRELVDEFSQVDT